MRDVPVIVTRRLLVILLQVLRLIVTCLRTPVIVNIERLVATMSPKQGQPGRWRAWSPLSTGWYTSDSETHRLSCFYCRLYPAIQLGYGGVVSLSPAQAL